MLSNKARYALALVGLVSLPTFATEARVEAMGKSTRYIMDDVSIFDNPANIGVYPNYLIGELGSYVEDVEPGKNLDPQSPWFGGIFALGLGEDKFRHPRISIAGAFNRKDENLHRFLPDLVTYGNKDADTVSIPTTVTNWDGFLGFSTPSGNLFGSHLYIALQEGIQDAAPGAMESSEIQANTNAYAAIVKADLGMNIKLNEDADWEAAMGFSRIHFGDHDKTFWEGSEWGYHVNTRLINTFEFLNGELVPAGEYKVIKAEDRDNTQFVAGLGLQVNMRSGFFWLGSEYFYEGETAGGWKRDASGVIIKTQGTTLIDNDGRSSSKEYGGRINFGIERNIWWDWFLIRVGGSKKISWYECTPAEGKEVGFCGVDGSWYKTNAIGDGTRTDHVGVGFGINVEEHLKVDAVVAEDIFYRNPFQGSGRLLSRVSATYQF
jgi:hypothetical protein